MEAATDAAGFAPQMAAAPGSPAPEAPAQQVPVATQGRKITYRADLSLEVKELEPSLAQARRLAEARGGYLAGLDQQGGRVGVVATATFRVPAESFAAVLDGLSGLGTVLHKSITADDVTEQYFDLDARVRNGKREEERLLALLQRAGKVSELLEVERELSRVRGEVEQIETQLRALRDRVSLSTLTLTLTVPADTVATAETDTWFRRTLSEAGAMFVGIGKALVRLLVYGFALAPYLGLGVVIVWVIRRARRRGG